MNFDSFIARHPCARLLRLIVDHNPFYLLSAASMLGGLLLLTNSLSYSPIPRTQLLQMIATLNCYELLIVGLAIWLIAKRNLIRDGSILLGIEALFLADTAMLNAEMFTIDRRLGAIVNLALLALAAVKLSIVFRALRIRSIGTYVLLLANFFLLFALPGFFKQISTHDNGRLSSLAIYGAWWAVGLLPLLFAYVFRRPAPFAIDRRPQAHSRLMLTFVFFTFGSILVHLRLSNWVYSIGWEWANLAPVVLGLAVCIGVIDHQVHTLALRLRTQLLLPIAAVAISLQCSNALLMAVGPIVLSPMRFALAGAMAVYLHGLWFHRHFYFAVGIAMCAAILGVGGTPRMALENFQRIWNWVVDFARRTHPRSARDWGLLSVISSFVLLVFGALVSLIKGQSSEAGSHTIPDEQGLPPTPVS